VTSSGGQGDSGGSAWDDAAKSRLASRVLGGTLGPGVGRSFEGNGWEELGGGGWDVSTAVGNDAKANDSDTKAKSSESDGWNFSDDRAGEGEPWQGRCAKTNEVIFIPASNSIY